MNGLTCGWRKGLTTALLVTALLLPVRGEAKTCWKIVAAAAGALALGVAGYALLSGDDDAPPILVVPDGTPVAREESEWRSGELSKLFSGGKLLAKIEGRPTIVVFTKNFKQLYAAGEVKAALKAAQPHLKDEPAMKGTGIPVIVEAIELKEEEGDPGRVFLIVKTAFMDLTSATSIKKADLMSGKPEPIEFAPFRNPAQTGTLGADLRIAVKYDSESDRLEVVSGLLTVTLKIPEIIDEEHRVAVPPLRSAPLRRAN